MNKQKIMNIFAIIVTVLLCTGLFSSCVGKKPDTNTTTTTGTDADFSTAGMQQIKYANNADYSLALANYKTAAETSTLSLLYNKDDGSIIVNDKRDNYNWTSSVDLPKAGITRKFNKLWRGNLSSIAYLGYYDADKNQGVDSVTTALEEDASISVATISNGIKVTYVFDELKIKFDVVLTLKDDELIVAVPFKDIREGTEYKISRIAILPVFGAASSKADGYCFYPDGCGAISKFSTKNVNLPAQTFTWTTYGNDDLNIKDYLSAQINNEQQAMLPVFGLKNGNNAFVSVITGGDADSTINYTPSNSIADLNSIYADFIYRRTIDMTEIAKSDLKTDQEEQVLKFDNAIQKKDAQVTYLFLAGSDADYSGMADRYRDYLLANNGIKTTNKQPSAAPLSLDIFMGAYEDRAMFSPFHTMTTFSQSEEILKTLSSNKVTNVMTTLIGWNTGGYRNAVMPASAESKLGGQSGLDTLGKYVKSNDSQLYLDENYKFLNDKYFSFSKKSDITIQGDTLPALLTENNVTTYLPNRYVVFNKFITPLLKLSEKMDTGVSLEGIGSLLYPDYNTIHPLTRMESEQLTIDNLKSIANKGINIASEGNYYTLTESSYIRDLPDIDSGLETTDEVVPFYQMVVHGIIPYSSTPGNLSADLTLMKLKWIEYGYMPSFEVTANSAQELKYTDYNMLFSSQFSQWKDTIISISNEINSKLGSTFNQKMIAHNQIANDVFKTVYGNGVSIYVNYNDNQVTVEGKTIPAKDYIVAKE